MKTRPTLARLAGPVLLAAAPWVCLQAQEAPVYAYPPGYGNAPSAEYAPAVPGAPAYAPPPAYETPAARPRFANPREFLPNFGRKVGDAFRRLFYGELQLSAPPPAQYGQGTAPVPGRSLDAAPRYRQMPPPVVQSAPPPAPVEKPVLRPAPKPATPPLSARSQPAPAVETKKRPAAPPPPKYTPPTLSRRSSVVPEEAPPAPEPPKPPKQMAAAKSETLPPPSPKPPEPGPTLSKPASEPPATTGSFLKGKRTGKAGRVISPYPPYQELDVTGLSSGSLALDPTTQKVFEIP